MIERLYEEVLLESSLKDMIIQNKQSLKVYFEELASLGVILSSPAIMATYVVKFLENNFPNLPESFLNKAIQVIENNQQVLTFIKGLIQN